MLPGFGKPKNPQTNFSVTEKFIVTQKRKFHHKTAFLANKQKACFSLQNKKIPTHIKKIINLKKESEIHIYNTILWATKL